MTLAEYVAGLTDTKREELREALAFIGPHASGRSVYSTRTPEERVLKALKSGTHVSTFDRVASMTSDELAALREALR